MLLDEFEQGRPVPAALTLWVKGYQQHAFFLDLIASLEPLPVPILVLNLEDISCPPARLLIPRREGVNHVEKDRRLPRVDA